MTFDTQSPEPTSFLALLEVHERLDETFLAHQEALLERDIVLAAEHLHGFGQALRSHIRVEEQILLPVYRRAEPVRGGAAELFLAEHKKLCAFLDRFEQIMRQMEDRPPDLKRRILHLLDLETSFKNLMEHHDLRERNILYPTLDRIIEGEERAMLLLRCYGQRE